MGEIRFVRGETAEVVGPFKEMLIEVGHYPKTHHGGSPTEPQLADVWLDPDAGVSTHAHSQHELKAVVEGTLIFGDTVLKPGDSAFVPGNTLHSYRAGPEGCRFWNFRQYKADSFLGDIESGPVTPERIRAAIDEAQGAERS